MKRFIIAVMAAFLSLGAVSAKGERMEVVFDVDIRCQNCINKIEQNIAFEKGVKDMECSLADKTVRIVYDASKTDVSKLADAFKAIGKTATVKSGPVDVRKK